MTKQLALALAITTLSILGVRADEDWVRFSEDGSRILVEAPGVSKMQGATHAVFSADGKYNYVISKDSLVGPIKHSSTSTPFGEAAVSTALMSATLWLLLLSSVLASGARPTSLPTASRAGITPGEIKNTAFCS